MYFHSLILFLHIYYNSPRDDNRNRLFLLILLFTARGTENAAETPPKKKRIG